MDQDRLTQTAAFALRVALGAMLIAHGLLLKLLVFAMEAVGGVLLALGIRSRRVALALVPILAGATWAHWGNGWMFGYPGGGWEHPLYLMLPAVVQAMPGDGAFALMRSPTPSLDWGGRVR